MQRWKSFFSRFGGLLVVSINVLIVAFILWTNPDWRAGLLDVFALQPIWLVVAVCLPLLCIWFDGMGFTYNARRFGRRLSYWDGAMVALMGRYYVAITPLGSGGQAAQLVELNRRGLPVAQATSATSVRFIANQFVHIALSTVSYALLFPQLPSLMRVAWPLGIVAYSAMPVCMVLFIWTPRIAAGALRLVSRVLGKLRFVKDPDVWRARIASLIEESVRGVRALDVKGWAHMALLGAMQVVCTMALPVAVYCAFGIAGVEPLRMMMYSIVLTTAVTIVPTPGNAGAAEGGFYFLFQSFFPPENLVTAMLLWRMAGYYLLLLLGIGVSIVRYVRGVRNKRRGESLA